MAYGKTIKIYLVDGTANGIVTAELSNWNGKAIKIPRTIVTKCDREDITEPGVYFLFCEEEDGTESVYIGEAENVKQRLATHITFHNQGRDSDKYYWHTAVIFTGRDLNKSKIRFLEDRFVNTAREVSRYSVLTKNTYSKTVMKESERSEMEEFADYVKILLNVLGYKVLEPLVETGEVKAETTATDDGAKAETAPETRETATPDTKTESAPQVKETVTASSAPVGDNLLYIKTRHASACGMVTAEGFVVLKGSKINPNTYDSLSDKQKKFRKKTIKSEKVDGVITTVDILFESPSTAASFVVGSNTGGLSSWKNEDGKTLKEIELEAKTATAGTADNGNVQANTTAQSGNLADSAPSQGAQSAQSEILHIKRKQFYAEGLATAEGFVVLKGAHVNPQNAEHLKDSEKTMRNKILNSSKVQDGVTTQNILFKSPSTAGLFVVGASSNGLTDWKNKDGVPLKEIELEASTPIDDITDFNVEAQNGTADNGKAQENATAQSGNLTVSVPSQGAQGAQSKFLYIIRNPFYARGYFTAKGFVVQEGARVNPQNAENLEGSERILRNRILNSYKVKDGVTTVDISFVSPSIAAVFVLGESANGWAERKNKDGVPLKDLE